MYIIPPQTPPMWDPLGVIVVVMEHKGYALDSENGFKVVYKMLFLGDS